MNHYSHPYQLFIFLMLLPLWSFATELQRGIQYGAGETITASKPGVNFTVPPGWIGAVSDDGDFIMQSNEHQGMLVITASMSMDQQATYDGLDSNPLELGENVILYPKGQVQTKEYSMLQQYQGTIDGAAMNGQVEIIYGHYNYMVTLVAICMANESAYYSQMMNKLSDSVRFFQPEQASHQTRPPETSQQSGGSTYINQSQNGSVVSGRNSDGQNCTYASAGGMMLKSCD